MCLEGSHYCNAKNTAELATKTLGNNRGGFRGVSEVSRNCSSVFKYSKHRFAMV